MLLVCQRWLWFRTMSNNSNKWSLCSLINCSSFSGHLWLVNFTRLKCILKPAKKNPVDIFCFIRNLQDGIYLSGYWHLTSVWTQAAHLWCFRASDNMVVNCANIPSTKFVPQFWWVNFFISLLNILCLIVWNIKPIGDIKVAVLIFYTQSVLQRPLSCYRGAVKFCTWLFSTRRIKLIVSGDPLSFSLLAFQGFH